MLPVPISALYERIRECDIGDFNGINKDPILEILRSLDIPEILRMSQTSAYFYLLIKHELPQLWKEIGTEVGLQDLENPTLDEIIKQLQEIRKIAKEMGIVAGPVTINNLKEELSKIQAKKLNDFLTVWQKIFDSSSAWNQGLQMPPEINIIQNPEIIERMFIDWWKTNIKWIVFPDQFEGIKFFPGSIDELKEICRTKMRLSRIYRACRLDL